MTITTSLNKYYKTEAESYVLVGRIEIDGILYWFDEETGEIMEPVKMLADVEYEADKLMNLDSYTYVSNTEQLAKRCNYSQADHNSTLSPVFSGMLNDLVANDVIKASAHKSFVKLGKKIQYRNVFVTDTKTLIKMLGTDAKNLSRELNKLKGLVEVKMPLGKKSEVRVLVFNAQLVWKGDVRVLAALSQRINTNTQPVSLEAVVASPVEIPAPVKTEAKAEPEVESVVVQDEVKGDWKQQAIELKAQGMKYKDIAFMVGKSEISVKKFMAAYNKQAK